MASPPKDTYYYQLIDVCGRDFRILINESRGLPSKAFSELNDTWRALTILVSLHHDNLDLKETVETLEKKVEVLELAETARKLEQKIEALGKRVEKAEKSGIKITTGGAVFPDDY